jgi:hypothetical protein
LVSGSRGAVGSKIVGVGDTDRERFGDTIIVERKKQFYRDRENEDIV